MSYHQKIQCNVAECTHNSIQDATCKLDKIQVTPCITRENSKTPEDETACAMYSYSGDLNAEETRASKQA